MNFSASFITYRLIYVESLGIGLAQKVGLIQTFMRKSMFMVVGALVTEKIIEPKLGTYKGKEEKEFHWENCRKIPL